MKKWRHILWVVVGGSLLSLFAGIFFTRHPLSKGSVIGTVQPYGLPVYAYEYFYNVQLVELTRNFYRQMAQRNGLSLDFFDGFLNLKRPSSEVALETLEEQKVVDMIHRDLKLELDEAFVKEKIVSNLHEQLFDPMGYLNERAYKQFVSQQFAIDVHEYEHLFERELKRDIVKNIVNLTAYVPRYQAAELYDQKSGKKSFAVLDVALEIFLKRAKAQGVAQEDLEAFYARTQDAYTIPEKRRAHYWVFDASLYTDDVVIDDAQIDAYYAKNQHTLFRVPPKVKVRRLVVTTQEEAQKLRDQILANPEIFGKLARKYSIDKDSAANQGVVDYFSSGTYDRVFEREAFSLSQENPLSEVVQTEAGFEVVQFIDRQAAFIKPLSTVCDEISKTLKTIAAERALAADLSRIEHESRSNPNAFEAFAKSKNVAINTSAWLTKGQTKGYAIDSLLSQKLFERAARSVENNRGVFKHLNQQVLFQETERESARIPALESVKDAVKDAFCKDQATNAMKEWVKSARSRIMRGEATMEILAKELGIEVIATGSVGAEEPVSALSRAPKMLSRAFCLASPKGQVFKEKYADGYFLAVLQEKEIAEPLALAEASSKLLSDELESQIVRYYPAFVASLRRNVTMNMNEHYQELQQPVRPYR